MSLSVLHLRVAAVSKERLNFLASGSRYGHANKFKESIPNSRRVNALPGRGTNTNSPVLNNSIKLVLKQTRPGPLMAAARRAALPAGTRSGHKVSLVTRDANYYYFQ